MYCSSDRDLEGRSGVSFLRYGSDHISAARHPSTSQQLFHLCDLFIGTLLAAITQTTNQTVDQAL